MTRRIRLEIDIDKLRGKMQENGIKSFKELATNCGLPWRQIYMILYRQTFSKETLYFISQELNCSMEDIICLNWDSK